MMFSTRVAARGMLLALFATCVIGCGTSYRGGAGSTSWGSGEEAGIPGVDSGMLTMSTQNVDGHEIRFAVWSDFHGGGVRSGSQSPGWVVEGTVGCRSGKEHPAPFKCTSSDGKTATMSIAGTDYDVANGGLFLVSTVGAKPMVKQVKCDLTKLPSDGDSNAEFAKSNKQIAEFFRNADAEIAPSDVDDAEVAPAGASQDEQRDQS